MGSTIRDILAWIVYVIVQILFIPLAIAGIALSVYAQAVVSKRLGVSGTAANVASERLIMHRFGIREDRAAERLLGALPNLSMLGGWLILLPWYLRYKISGKTAGYPALSTPGEETIASMVADRTVAIDRIIEKSIGKVEQFVCMGAGYDTRCYGALNSSGLKLFELDQAPTQRLKRASLQKAGIDASAVRFVEVDFAAGDWTEKLREAGYDPGKPSLLLWEGVTLYLTEEAVRKTLRAIKAMAAPGSILVCDFYARAFVTTHHSGRGRAMARVAAMSDEGLGFGLDFSRDHAGALASFLASENLAAGDTYFMGSQTKPGAFMVVAEIKL